MGGESRSTPPPPPRGLCLDTCKEIEMIVVTTGCYAMIYNILLLHL